MKLRRHRGAIPFSAAWRVAGACSLLAGALLFPLRVQANAPAGRYVATGATVLDKKTGLTWQQSVPAGAFTWSDAMSYCSTLGTTLGGSGWRLPAIKELQSLLDVSATAPAIDTSANGFSGTPTDQPFWSATVVASSPDSAWWVLFGGVDSGGAAGGAIRAGMVNGGAKTTQYHVRCVRSSM